MSDKLTVTRVLTRYFRDKGQPISEWSAELKALNDTEKLDLAQSAAEMMGYSPDILAFDVDYG